MIPTSVLEAIASDERARWRRLTMKRLWDFAKFAVVVAALLWAAHDFWALITWAGTPAGQAFCAEAGRGFPCP